MSRIDTRNDTFINQRTAQGSSRVNPAEQSSQVAGAFGVRNVRSKLGDSFRAKSKKKKRLASASDISEALLQPIAGRKRDEFIGDLTRLMNTLSNIEKSLGEDETSMLCKVMLKEQIRRLLLVEGAQVDADNLRGSA